MNYIMICHEISWIYCDVSPKWPIFIFQKWFFRGLRSAAGTSTRRTLLLWIILWNMMIYHDFLQNDRYSFSRSDFFEDCEPPEARQPGEPCFYELYHDMSWYIIIYNYIMIYHDISLNIMIYHDISWYIMKYHDISRFFTKMIDIHLREVISWGLRTAGGTSTRRTRLL